ncbi:small ubiquitin-related modifier protein [Aureococcus anophagefferens]|uniref:Small ubiquitin-related modifier protein n=1 Tax=Aureococcus anophagefferens TaxID=44056 RepID=A0ABR1G1U3_AURAN
MADEEDKKPSKEAGGENSLNIRIRDQTGEETFFKVKKTTKLDKVFNAAQRARAPTRTPLRFLFDGQRVRGDQTPQDIDMDDGDQLDCMLEQQGGR